LGVLDSVLELVYLVALVLRLSGVQAVQVVSRGTSQVIALGAKSARRGIGWILVVLLLLVPASNVSHVHLDNDGLAAEA